MNSSSVPAVAFQPRSASRASWRAQDLARRRDHVRAVLPGEIRHQEDGAVVPRDRAQRVEVGLHDEVAVAALPARHLVAGDGVHVDVDGQQVVAALGVVLDDLVEEVRRGEALALQAPLHVGDHEQDCVDLARGGGLSQFVERHWCAVTSSSSSVRTGP